MMRGLFYAGMTCLVVKVRPIENAIPDLKPAKNSPLGAHPPVHKDRGSRGTRQGMRSAKSVKDRRRLKSHIKKSKLRNRRK